MLTLAPMQRDELNSRQPRNQPGQDKRPRNMNAGGDSYDNYERQVPPVSSTFIALSKAVCTAYPPIMLY